MYYIPIYIFIRCLQIFILINAYTTNHACLSVRPSNSLFLYLKIKTSII